MFRCVIRRRLWYLPLLCWKLRGHVPFGQLYRQRRYDGSSSTQTRSRWMVLDANENGDFLNDIKQLRHRLLQCEALTTSSSFEADHDLVLMENLGKLFLQYSTVDYLLKNSGENSWDRANQVASDLSQAMAEVFLGEQSFHEYLGRLCLHDLSTSQSVVCQTLAEKFGKVEGGQVLSKANTLLPKIDPGDIDYDLLWNSKSKKSTFELPELENPKLTFHPLYVESFEKLGDEEVMKLLWGTNESDSKAAIDMLRGMKDYGNLIYEFHLLSHLFKIMDPLDPKFSTILKNLQLILKDIVKFSCLRKVTSKNLGQELLLKYNRKDWTNVFYQYIAVLTLANKEEANSVSLWIGNLVAKLAQNDRTKSIGSFLKNDRKHQVPAKHLKVKKPSKKRFSIDKETVEKFILGSAQRDCYLKELEIIGIEAIEFLVRYFILLSKPGTSWRNREEEKKHLYKLIAKFVPQPLFDNGDDLAGFKDCLKGLNSSHLAGLYIVQDFDEFMKVMKQQLVSLDSGISLDGIHERIKYIIFEVDPPPLRLSFEGGEGCSNTRSETQLPALHDKSISSRFTLINMSLITPVDGSWVWFESLLAKNALNSVRELGESLYNLGIRRALLKGLPSIGMSYFNPLLKMFRSHKFQMTVLDESETFSIFLDDNYRELLMNKRYSKSLVGSQFSQCLATLYLQDDSEIMKWFDKRVQRYTDTINLLSHEEIIEVLEKSNHLLVKHNFSLCESFNTKTFQSIAENKIKLVWPMLEHLDTPKKLPSLFDADKVGRELMQFVIAFRIMRYGLDSFIQAKNDTMDLLNLLSEDPNVKSVLDKRTTSEYFGQLASSEGVEITRKQLENSLDSIYGDMIGLIKPEEIPDINVKLKLATSKATFSVWGSNIVLPSPQNSSPLHKLLLINFLISRSYLNMKKCQVKSIHRLPDICTKFNTIGGHYYNFLISLHINKFATTHQDFPTTLLDKVAAILCDRVFLTLICQVSDILFDPFDDPQYKALAENYIINDYYFLRFGHQSFKQYIGSMCFHDPHQLDQWVQSLVDSLVDALSNLPNGKRSQFLLDLKAKLHTYYKLKSI